MEEYNIDELVSNLDVEMHEFHNGIYLTKKQIEILKSYGFDYTKYNNMKSLIFDINDYLEEVEDETLESVLYELSEFDYYHNTNK